MDINVAQISETFGDSEDIHGVTFVTLYRALIVLRIDSIGKRRPIGNVGDYRRWRIARGHLYCSPTFDPFDGSGQCLLVRGLLDSVPLQGSPTRQRKR